MKQRASLVAGWLGAAALCATSNALAFPGFFAGKTGAETVSRSTQVVVMKNGEQSVVSVMTDYQGPGDSFAMVLPVPSDVTTEQAKVLKRDDVERLENLSAPRFHEFWEMDPCEPGKPIQLWERNMRASASTDFLGAGKMFEGTTKVPKEMKISVEPSFRDLDQTEFELEVVASGLESWLSKRGYKIPSAAKEKVQQLTSDGLKFLVAEVDPKKAGVGARGDVLLSPIRYSTKQEVKIHSTLGLAHLKGHQELLVYVLDPDKRYQASNYDNSYPPTNVQVDFKVKERMGEFYSSLHDKMLAKKKDAFLVEYAWNTSECGQPCPNAAIHLHELLTLGGDHFESLLDEETRHPEPPERTEAEQELYDAAEKPEQERKDHVRVETARRKALVKRQGDYVLTRLHHRYGKDGLPKDVELSAAGHVQGGVESPQGENGDMPVDVKPAEKSRLQTRYYHLHPNKKVVKCEKPEPYRWAKPPRSYRGARKIWVADQLATRNRKKIKAEEVVYTPIASLGLKAVPKPGDKPATDEKPSEDKSCDCRAVGSDSRPATAWMMLGLALLAAVAGRRRSRLH